MSNVLRKLFLGIARAIGSKIYDCRSGEFLGRALVFSWRGRIVIIGLERVVIPEFLPQKRLTYWKQKLAFRAAPVPDFPHERRP